jgi:5-methylcytosine-specific restriction protein A
MREAQVLKQRSGHDKWRGSSASRGYDYKWQKFRTKYLKLHPVCVMCGRIATEVDHIIPFGDDLSRVYEIDNLQPLCHECHSRKTASENRVRPTKKNPEEQADGKLET